jgi:hypothetical protein
MNDSVTNKITDISFEIIPFTSFQFGQLFDHGQFVEQERMNWITN